MNTEDKQLNDAAEKYSQQDWIQSTASAFNGFIAGATSNEAKDYWYAQFQLEQKQLTEQDIIAMAEKEYESLTAPNYFSDGIKSKFITAFIKGFKAALRESSVDKSEIKGKTKSPLFGINCTAPNCTEPAVGDYNGYGAYGCQYHMNKWNNEFDDDYK